MLVLGGVRGGISIALALSIPDGHRHGDVRRFPVFGSGTVVVGQRRRKSRDRFCIPIIVLVRLHVGLT
jgi:hypothetical protein